MSNVFELFKILLFSSLMVFPAPSNQDNWSLGLDLLGGDSYNYHICDPSLLVSESFCYDIELTFLDTLRTHDRSVWIVQATIIHDGNLDYAIFHIDEDSFDVQTDVFSKPYGDSVEKTLFWMQQYAPTRESKPLKVGSSWGDVSEFLTPDENLMVKSISDFSFNGMGGLYDVGFSRANFVISQNHPFPFDAQVQRPAPLEKQAFSFTINSVSNSTETLESDFMRDFTSTAYNYVEEISEEYVEPFVFPEPVFETVESVLSPENKTLNNFEDKTDSIEEEEDDFYSLFMDIYEKTTNSTGNMKEN